MNDRLRWKVIAAGLLGGALCATPALATMQWTQRASQPRGPQAEAAAAPSAHHGGRGPGYTLVNGGGAEAVLWLPTLVRRPVMLHDGSAMVRPSGLDNYHLLVATRESAEVMETALLYAFMHGKPSGVSPSLLLAEQTATLELVPTPLPREHWRYESRKPAAFQVRLRGVPLANSAVGLRTANGTELSAQTDAKGRVVFELPDDFDDVSPGRGANLPGEFVASVTRVVDGRRLVTTLTAPYYVSPSHWQSTLGGVLSMVAGFVGGLVLVRRSRGRAA